MRKVYTGYHGTSEIEHGLCACTVDIPQAKARGLSLCTGAQTMLYLSPGRPSIWRLVGQVPFALAVGASGGCLDIFYSLSFLSSSSLSLGDGSI